jgi:hypothetical protein
MVKNKLEVRKQEKLWLEFLVLVLLLLFCGISSVAAE